MTECNHKFACVKCGILEREFFIKLLIEHKIDPRGVTNLPK